MVKNAEVCLPLEEGKLFTLPDSKCFKVTSLENEFPKGNANNLLGSSHIL